MHNEGYFKKLKEELSGKFSNSYFENDVLMSSHTTFKIGGPCDLYVEAAISELPDIISILKEQQVPITILGNGSNVLVSDDGIDGAVILIGKRASSITVCADTVVAEAGALLSQIANTACENNLTGLEFAAGIPGSVGGAVYMNAGAYEGTIDQVLDTVKVLTPDGEIVERKASELELSYRHSVFMTNGEIILLAKFKLFEAPQGEIRALMDELREKRVSKQPLNYPSAGSTFKRPQGYFAAKLIDDAGLRGYRVGGAMVSTKHCGFVINYDNATCSDIRQLMSDVDRIVFEKFNVSLEPEIRMIGRNL